MINDSRSNNLCVRARNSIKCFMFFLANFQKNINGAQDWKQKQDGDVKRFFDKTGRKISFA